MDQLIFHEMTVTFLDGVRRYVDGGRKFGPVPKSIWAKRYPSNPDNMLAAVADPILVQYQDRNYLIDAALSPEALTDKIKAIEGMGDEPSLVSQSLRKLGLTEEDIDVILMTHMHNDHASGLVTVLDGEFVSKFPQAKIYINAQEWEDVQAPISRTAGTYLKQNWETIQDQVETFGDYLEVNDAIEVFHTGGHSRGQSIIRFKQGNEYLIHMSDLIQAVVQERPNWVSGVDDYPLDTIAAKEKWVGPAIDNHYKFLFYHDPYYTWVEFNDEGKGFKDFQRRSRQPLISWPYDIVKPE